MEKPIVTLASVCAAVLFTSNAQAALIAHDSFTTSGADPYTVAKIHGQSPTTGSSGFNGATAWGGGFSTGDISVVSSGLTATLAVAPAGGSVSAAGGATDRNVYRTFNSFTATNQTYYYSFLFNVGTGATAAARSSFGITTATAPNGPNPVDGVMLGIDMGASTTAGTVNLWVAGNSIALSGSGFSAGNTYFALVQIDNSTTGNDTITANFYSATATDFSSSLGTATTSAYDISSQLVGIEVQKDFGGNSTRYDEFYFGTTIAEVSSIPEPSPSLMLLGGVGMFFLFRRRA